MQDARSLWSIVLAGGEGIRLRPLVRLVHADDRPKQFAVLVGSRSLLRRTLDRSERVVSPARTVVVTMQSQARFLARELSSGEGPVFLAQLCDRGTAAGVLLPAHWVSWRDPDATVVILPSDHYVADDAAFMGHVEALAGVVERHPELILLVGAQPEGPQPDYGWIEPGARIEATAGGIRRVDRFHEKPGPELARECMERGGLWNTFVMVAKVSALIEAGRRSLPDLHERLARVAPFASTASEAPAIARAYRLARPANFSEAILASPGTGLAVSTLPPVSWSDWGTPDRVLESIHRQGLEAPWLRELAPTA